VGDRKREKRGMCVRERERERERERIKEQQIGIEKKRRESVCVV
jgi:hypothetical protein